MGSNHVQQYVGAYICKEHLNGYIYLVGWPWMVMKYFWSPAKDFFSIISKETLHTYHVPRKCWHIYEEVFSWQSSDTAPTSSDKKDKNLLERSDNRLPSSCRYALFKGNVIFGIFTKKSVRISTEKAGNSLSLRNILQYLCMIVTITII
jgi:hypothetical protein